MGCRKPWVWSHPSVPMGACPSSFSQRLSGRTLGSGMPKVPGSILSTAKGSERERKEKRKDLSQSPAPLQELGVCTLFMPYRGRGPGPIHQPHPIPLPLREEPTEPALRCPGCLGRWTVQVPAQGVPRSGPPGLGAVGWRLSSEADCVPRQLCGCAVQGRVRLPCGQPGAQRACVTGWLAA